MIQVKGKVHVIGETETRGENGFRVRQLVVDNGNKYQNFIPIQFVKEGVDLLDALEVGQEVVVNVTIGGSQWKDRYFPNINGDSIEGLSSEGIEPSTEAPANKNKPKAKPQVVEDEEDTDLPF